MPEGSAGMAVLEFWLIPRGNHCQRLAAQRIALDWILQ
jgi:hypothetical protein